MVVNIMIFRLYKAKLFICKKKLSHREHFVSSFMSFFGTNSPKAKWAYTKPKSVTLLLDPEKNVRIIHRKRSLKNAHM